MESNDNRLELGGVVNPLLPQQSIGIVLTAILPPDSYTAIVEGVNATTGVALVELYDLEPGSFPHRQYLHAGLYRILRTMS